MTKIKKSTKMESKIVENQPRGSKNRPLHLKIYPGGPKRSIRNQNVVTFRFKVPKIAKKRGQKSNQNGGKINKRQTPARSPGGSAPKVNSMCPRQRPLGIYSYKYIPLYPITNMGLNRQPEMLICRAPRRFPKLELGKILLSMY